MKSDNDSEHNSEPQRPHSDSNQINIDCPPKISSRKKVARSADHSPQQIDNTDFLIERQHHVHEVQIKPVIKKEDLAKQYEFGKQIVRSEQFSVDAQLLQSTNKQKLNREIRWRSDSHQKLQLNIMVCGGKEIGKTSFIQAFENSKLCGIQSLRNQTVKITTRKFVRKVSNQIYDITMIDTPGYIEGNYSQYLQLIQNDITNKLEAHYEKQQQQKKDRNRIISGDKRDRNDQRVHCCLFFLKGPKVHQQDCLIMKTLQKYVNIIPILAKGDCYTMQQIKKFKRDLFLAKQKYQLMWMECQQILRAKNPDYIKLLLQGPFGVAPPFVIISGVCNIITSSNRVIQGRVYNWGTIDISNPKHSDFSLLSDMILLYFNKVLVELTSFIQVEHVRQIQREKQKLKKQVSKISQKKSKSKYPFTKAVGQGALIGFFGWCIYKIIQRKAQQH